MAGSTQSGGLPKEDSESQPKQIWLLLLERVWETDLGHEQGEEYTREPAGRGSCSEEFRSICAIKSRHASMTFRMDFMKDSFYSTKLYVSTPCRCVSLLLTSTSEGCACSSWRYVIDVIHHQIFF